GFIPDIERIFGLTPFTRQTLFFSATMAPEIERITNTFLSNPARIEVARQATTSENITQGVVMFKATRKDREASEKQNLLRMLIDAEGDKCTNAIIFCNRKMDVDAVAKSLKKNGYDAAPIHGDLDQSQRTKTLDGFRAGDLRFLVASDVAARGLDVPSVSHVFNFDVPSHAEDYVHHIGRTGRAGRDGKAIMICTTRDEKNFEDVERLVQKEIPRMENPLGNAAPAEETPKAAETKKPRAPQQPRDEQTSDDTSDKPKRSRSRSRKKSDAPVAESAPAEEATPIDALPTAKARTTEPPKANSRAMSAPDAEAEKADTPKPPEPKAESQRPDTSKNVAPKDDRQSSSRSRGGSSRNNNERRDDNRGGSNNNRVVGLGDHTPQFIELSFADRPKD
ncbi:MAG: DEAD/DEAH box helicase, partial [Sulfitobacter sp.]|nr:DEAD/DEAH box helicase [Sulfitobacter sp.]